MSLVSLFNYGLARSYFSFVGSMLLVFVLGGTAYLIWCSLDV